MAIAANSCQMCMTPAKETEEGKLFSCPRNGCHVQNKMLCLSCGIMSHKNINAVDHEFGGKERNDNILQTQASSAMLQVQNPGTSNKNNAASQLVFSGINASVGAVQFYKIGVDVLTKAGMDNSSLKLILKAATKRLTTTGGKDVLKGIAKSTAVVGGILQIALCAWEIKGNYDRYNNHIIDKEELSRLNTRSVTSNTCAFAGSMGGAAAGFAIGGPPGAVIGGLIGGVAGNYGSRYVFDRFIWNNESQKKHKKDIKLALHWFHFNKIKLIWNDEEFNKQQLQKRYYDSALECHPDRKDGTDEKFERLIKYYNILTGILKEKENRQSRQKSE
eukprot:143884_1